MMTDHRTAQALGNPIQRCDGDEDHQDQEADLLPFQNTDLLRQMKANAAGTDDPDDCGGPRVGLEKVENLARKDGQHLRYQSETDCVQPAAAADSTPSTGRRSAASIASDISLPNAPMSEDMMA